MARRLFPNGMLPRQDATIVGRRKRRVGSNHNPLLYERFEARMLLTVSTELLPGLEKLVLNYVASQPETAYLQEGQNDLSFVAVDTDGKSATYLFQQTANQIPVHEAFVTVVQRNGSFQSVHDRGVENLDTSDLSGRLVRARAAEQLADSLITEPHRSTSAELVWVMTDSKTQLAWQVDSFVGHLQELNSTPDYQTFVDADSGTLLMQETPYELVEYLLENPQVEVGEFPRIVVRDSVGVAGARAYAAPFDAVVELSVGCTGTLIASNTVLTARHCGANTGTQIFFGDNGNSPTFMATVQSRFNPAGNSGSLLGGGDVSILTLTGNVPSNIATPMRLIAETSSLVGQVIATLGYGYNGLGSQGHGFNADGWRWGGENILDRYGSPSGASGSNIFSTDFDSGSNGNNTIPGSSPTPLEFEATTAPGDSGGPILVQVAGGEWVIAGVLSGGTTATSVYGDISWWTGIALYQDAIEDRGGVFVGQEFSGTVAPESLNIVRGTLNSGNVGNLEFSDNIDLDLGPDASPSSSLPAAQIIIGATSPEQAPSQLAFRLESNANTFNLAQSIEAFNFNNGQYEFVNIQHETVNVDDVLNVTLTGDLSRFVDNATGEMRTRISWDADGPLLFYPWSVEIDQAAWVINGGAGPLGLLAGGDDGLSNAAGEITFSQQAPDYSGILDNNSAAGFSAARTVVVQPELAASDHTPKTTAQSPPAVPLRSAVQPEIKRRFATDALFERVTSKTGVDAFDWIDAVGADQFDFRLTSGKPAR